MKRLFLILSLILLYCNVHSQCSCTATDYSSINVSGWTVGQTGTITTCLYAGERATIQNTVSGAVYLISTCGASYDTQLSIYTTSCVYVAYNDDNGPDCTGLQASIQFVSPGGNLYSVLNLYPCGTNSTCTTVTIKLISLTSPMMIPTSGNNSYTVCSGHLYDNGGNSNYNNNANGYSVIYPSTIGNKIQISGSYVTESNYDYIYIYNGVGTGTLLGTYNGTGTIPLFTSTDVSGALTIRFVSDVSIVYSGFDITISCIDPLPIELGAFSIMCNGSTRHGIFTTMSENNVNHFELQVSTDMMFWNILETITAVGYSSTYHNYDWYDLNDYDTQPTIYYELIEYDNDGYSKIFGIYSSTCSLTDIVEVYPNPVNVGEPIYVTSTNVIEHIEVVDLLGRNATCTFKDGKITGLSSGVYFININDINKFKIIVK